MKLFCGVNRSETIAIRNRFFHKIGVIIHNDYVTINEEEVYYENC